MCARVNVGGLCLVRGGKWEGKVGKEQKKRTKKG